VAANMRTIELMQVSRALHATCPTLPTAAALPSICTCPTLPDAASAVMLYAQRLETRLSREKYWDQTAYNEEIFFLSHDEYRSPQVRMRNTLPSLGKWTAHLLFGSLRCPLCSLCCCWWWWWLTCWNGCRCSCVRALWTDTALVACGARRSVFVS
jgi:hypothetical protein